MSTVRARLSELNLHADLAQLVEHRYRKPRVTGSTPAAGINSMFLPSANRDNQHCTDVLLV